MADLKEMAATAALNDMMRRGSFSICTIDSVSKMLDVNPRGEVYDLLRTLHCVSFDKMQPELRAQIPALIQSCIGAEPNYKFESLPSKVTINVVDQDFEDKTKPKSSAILWLMGKSWILFSS